MFLDGLFRSCVSRLQSSEIFLGEILCFSSPKNHILLSLSLSAVFPLLSRTRSLFLVCALRFSDLSPCSSLKLRGPGEACHSAASSHPTSPSPRPQQQRVCLQMRAGWGWRKGWGEEEEGEQRLRQLWIIDVGQDGDATREPTRR